MEIFASNILGEEKTVFSSSKQLAVTTMPMLKGEKTPSKLIFLRPQWGRDNTGFSQRAAPTRTAKAWDRIYCHYNNSLSRLDERELDSYARSLGCEQEVWPIKYLGLPLGHNNPRALSFWQLVLEKMPKRLGTWKRNYLSLGGRIALIKSSLSNLPTYYMSIFKAPGKVVKAIEKM